MGDVVMRSCSNDEPHAEHRWRGGPGETGRGRQEYACPGLADAKKIVGAAPSVTLDTCPECGAGVGYPCVEPSGEFLGSTHPHRTQRAIHPDFDPAVKGDFGQAQSMAELHGLDITRSLASQTDDGMQGRWLDPATAKALIWVMQPDAVVGWLRLWSGTINATRVTMEAELLRVYRVSGGEMS